MRLRPFDSGQISGIQQEVAELRAKEAHMERRDLELREELGRLTEQLEEAEGQYRQVMENLAKASAREYRTNIHDLKSIFLCIS